MNKHYEVILTRDMTESTVLEVVAPDANAAQKVAFDKADDPTVRWHSDDNYLDKPYVTGVEEFDPENGEEVSE